jgi:hypothetical protein
MASSMASSMDSRRFFGNTRKKNNNRVSKCNTDCTSDVDLDFCVITDTHISVRDCLNWRAQKKYHYITTCELSTDTLQYAITNSLVHCLVNLGTPQKQYITFTDFPALQIEQSYSSKVKDTRQNSGLIHCYEGDDIKLLDQTENIRNYLNTAEFITNVQIDDVEKYPSRIKINIDYVKKIASSLNNGVEYKCDLDGIAKKYIIIDKINIDAKEYVICGYPDPTKMRYYLKMYEQYTDKLVEIHNYMKTNYSNLYKDLYNAINKTDKIINIDEDIHKLYWENVNINYIKTWYEQNKNNPIVNEKLSEERIKGDLKNYNDFLEIYRKYLNEIYMEYLNKPMMRIRYNFIIFEKYNEKGIEILVPAIFNLKDITPKHTVLLERVQVLIQNEIPKIFGILDIQSKVKDYKLFHSYVRYGDFFHITTEYLHIFTNTTRYAYTYKNSILLEELIYASSKITDRGEPFLQKLKLEYDVKKYKLDIEKQPIDTQNNIYKPTRTTSSRTARTTRNVRTKIFRNTSNNSKIDKHPFTEPTAKIITIYEKQYATYDIFYKSETNNQIYKLTLKSNIANELKSIENIIRNNLYEKIYLCDKNSINVAKFDTPTFKLFEILEHRPIIDEDLKMMLKVNPLIYKSIITPRTTNIDMSIMFKNELLPLPLPLSTSISYTIKNLYTTVPILIYNIMTNPIYKDAILKYFEKISNANTTNSSNVSNMGNMGNNERTREIIRHNNRLLSEYGRYNKFKCIINPANTGYNIVEIYETYSKVENGTQKILGKTVLWIIPMCRTENPFDIDLTKYIGDFTYLNETHLPILEFIKNKYQKGNKYCFIHMLPSLKFFCLHIHVIDKQSYIGAFSEQEKGTGAIREKYISEIINNIKTYGQYYNELNINMIKHI